MPKLRRLSGQDLLRIFAGFGFHPVPQRGSHVQLRRIGPGATRQTLTAALHVEVDMGTLRVIFRQALRYIAEAELRPHFNTEA